VEYSCRTPEKRGKARDSKGDERGKIREKQTGLKGNFENREKQTPLQKARGWVFQSPPEERAPPAGL